mmetsp:Transcript_38535/g.90990  ORF Transcript_38535/g.90990 Transcript_38535/m.90990 type:complete len:203 (+) Transcript_38535:79-687(+)
MSRPTSASPSSTAPRGQRARTVQPAISTGNPPPSSSSAGPTSSKSRKSGNGPRGRVCPRSGMWRLSRSSTPTSWWRGWRRWATFWCFSRTSRMMPGSQSARSSGSSRVQMTRCRVTRCRCTDSSVCKRGTTTWRPSPPSRGRCCSSCPRATWSWRARVISTTTSRGSPTAAASPRPSRWLRRVLANSRDTSSQTWENGTSGN